MKYFVSCLYNYYSKHISMIIKIFMNCATILNCPTEPTYIKSYCKERNRCDISLKVPPGYLFIDDNDDV